MVFLDADVLLEIILKDRPHVNQAKQFLEALDDDTAISLLTAHLIMHFGRKEHIVDGLLERVIGENELLAITPEDYIWAAKHEQGRDFEDALQIAAALRHGCDTFVTFDSSLARTYADISIQIVALSD